MGLHHQTLKAAVAKYGPLSKTLSVDALKAEVAKDEKNFSTEDIAEILSAVDLENAGTTGATTNSTNEEDKGTSNQIQGQTLTSETPAWVEVILKAVQQNVESNDKLIAAIDQFKDAAKELVKNVIPAQQSANIGASTESAKEAPVLTKGASYVVKADVKFRDRENFKREYTPGEDVSHLDKDILKSLLERGLIQEA